MEQSQSGTIRAERSWNAVISTTAFMRTVDEKLRATQKLKGKL
jgi:hypothetical protein